MPRGDPPIPRIAVPAINMFIDCALEAIAAPATPQANGTTMNHFCNETVALFSAPGPSGNPRKIA